MDNGSIIRFVYPFSRELRPEVQLRVCACDEINQRRLLLILSFIICATVLRGYEHVPRL